MERDDKYSSLSCHHLDEGSIAETLKFFFSIISVELTTFPLLTHTNATQEAPFICTKIPTINYELETLILLTPKQFFSEVIP